MLREFFSCSPLPNASAILSAASTVGEREGMEGREKVCLRVLPRDSRLSYFADVYGFLAAWTDIFPE